MKKCNNSVMRIKGYSGYILPGFLGGLLSFVLAWVLFSLSVNDTTGVMDVSGDASHMHYASYYSSPDREIITPDFGLAARKSVHAVVHIKTEYERPGMSYEEFFGFPDFFGRSRPRGPARGSGSGVIVESSGYIVTNNHVVESADKITVTLNDKRTFDAEVVGLDPNTDLALIRIEASNLPILEMGDSEELSVGEWVLAVGNPFNLTSTVTAGIVSAKARNINILGRRAGIESFIQTDAAVNRGNSGGALVNTRGELVGINAAIASSTGSYTGYSFAIPVNIARKVIYDLKEYGVVQRAFLGVNIRELTSELAEEQGINMLRGVYVHDVLKGGAAEKAVLENGDVIISLDGKPVESTGRLLGLVAGYSPGDTITMSYLRDNDTNNTLLVLKNERGETTPVTVKEKSVASLLGATFENLSEKQLEEYGINQGVKVTEIKAGKLKAAGVREGFIITRIDREGVSSVNELKQKLSGKSGGVLLEGVYPGGVRAYYGFGL